MKYAYKVVPAPTKGKRGKGLHGGAARFAHALEDLMNELGAEGWEYQRTDTLPAEERAGLTGKVTVFKNMLVFRRAVEMAEPAAPAPEIAAPTVAKAHAAALPAAPEIPALGLPDNVTTLDTTMPPKGDATAAE